VTSVFLTPAVNQPAYPADMSAMACFSAVLPRHGVITDAADASLTWSERQKESPMSSLIINTLFFLQRWREAAYAGQSDHRFHSHSEAEQEHFEHRRKRQFGRRRLRSKS
jgi:hypothetical protein